MNYLKINNRRGKLTLETTGFNPVPCNDFTGLVSQVIELYKLLPEGGFSPYTVETKYQARAGSYLPQTQYQLQIESGGWKLLTRGQVSVLERVVTLGNKLARIGGVLDEHLLDEANILKEVKETNNE